MEKATVTGDFGELIAVQNVQFAFVDLNSI